MSETPFYINDNGERSDIMGPNGVVYSCISTPEAKSHVSAFNHAWTAAGGPELTRQRDELLALLKDVQWKGDPTHRNEPTCPLCGGIAPDDVPSEYRGHLSDCRLAAAIGGGA